MASRRRVVACRLESGRSRGSGRRRRRTDLLHSPARRPRQASLRRFDLKKREEETLADGIDEFQISAEPQEDPLCSSAAARRASRRPDRQWASSTRASSPRARMRFNLGRDLGAGRASRRMGTDPSRSVANQPRLLLCDQHARRRLERDLAEIRRAAAPPGQPRRLESRHADDAQRAVGRPQLPGRR